MTLLRPFRARGSLRGAAVLGAGWVGAALLAWALSPFQSLPTLREIAGALGRLWSEGGLGAELFATTRLIAVSLAITVALSLVLAYASVIPAVRPLTHGVAKLRFLGLTGLVFPLTLATGGGFRLKVALLTFGMTTFLVTAVARIVDEVPRAEIDQMRVLGASDARVAWEVIVRGTLDRTLDAVRQNLAMGWSMITMVEGISRSDGGIGAVILNQNKHFHLAEVYAVLAVVLVVGLVLDHAMGVLGLLLCPHTRVAIDDADAEAADDGAPLAEASSVEAAPESSS